ncbi:MAG: hypothetical protein ACK5M3_09530 [Dysgonomonas sp.]
MKYQFTHFCICLFFAIMFSSCDFGETRDFIIINKLDSDIVIRTVKGFDEIYFTDSIHVIKPNTEMRFWEDMGLCGMNEHPKDLFDINDTLPPCKKFELYVADSLVHKKVFIRSNWDFKSKKQTGEYRIEITEDILPK